MGLFQQISLEAKTRELRFLVIGGLAINFHGCSRDTADLDLLIARDARGRWVDILLGLGYVIYCDRGVFVQLTPPAQGAWPVDLMLVSEATFQPMFAAGIGVEMFGAAVLIPSLEHLLALKLHALKHGHDERFMKDYLDVENLMRATAWLYTRKRFASYSKNMARWNCMKKSAAPPPADASKLNDSVLSDDRLEFPIAPDFVSRPPRIDPQVMLSRIEENLPWRSARPGERERRAAAGIPVEFVL